MLLFISCPAFKPAFIEPVLPDGAFIPAFIGPVLPDGAFIPAFVESVLPAGALCTGVEAAGPDTDIEGWLLTMGIGGALLWEAGTAGTALPLPLLLMSPLLEGPAAGVLEEAGMSPGC